MADVVPATGWQGLRERAQARAAAIGLPTTKREDWRYVRVEPLKRTEFAGKPRSDKTDLGTLLGPTQATNVIQLVDGRLDRSGGTAGFNDSLRFDAVGDDRRYEGLLACCDDPTVCWSFADAPGDGGPLRLHVCAGAPISLALVSWATAGRSGARLAIDLERGAQLDLVILHHLSDARSSIGFDVEVGPGAQLRVDEVQCTAPGSAAQLFSSSSLRLDRDARVAWTTVANGGELVRFRTEAALTAPGAELALAGLAVVGGNRQAHHWVRVEHRVGDTTSRQSFKDIADGESTASFDGLVTVAKGADRTNAQQTSRNLLLSPKARIDARPQLDIFADDVKAGHGATIGSLDLDELFYLRARGVPAAQARGILTRAFAGEIVELLHSPYARALAEREILASLSAATYPA